MDTLEPVYHHPKPQTLQTLQTQEMAEYTINYVLHTGDPCTVSIPKNWSLTQLKKQIKNEMTPLLNNFSPFQLNLYKVNLDGSNDRYIEEAKCLARIPAGLYKIQPFTLVLMVFPKQPDLTLQRIHILVVPAPRESLDPRMCHCWD